MYETFSGLLRDSAHWEFELLVGFLEMLVFDGLVIGLCWPFIRKHWQHHLDRDREELWSDLHHTWLLGKSPLVQDWSLSSPGHVKTEHPFTKKEIEDY